MHFHYVVLELMNCAYALINLHSSLKTCPRVNGHADDAAHFKQG